MTTELSARTLYRLPWTLGDNPSVWLELTDICNVSCPGCYRQRLEGHAPLEKLKEQIRQLKSSRNCHHMSLGGGEPLLHPHLAEVIEYARSEGLKPLLLTNGRRLTYDVLRELKGAGLFGVAFHVDRMQRREPEWTNRTEAELNVLRQRYVDMVHEVKGLYCSMGMTVFPDNLNELPDVVRWASKNVDRVHGLRFTLFGSSPTPENGDLFPQYDSVVRAYGIDGRNNGGSGQDDEYGVEDVWRIIQSEAPDCQASAYIGGTASFTSLKFLIGVQIASAHRIYGCFGTRTMEFMQTIHHFLYGTYPMYRSNNRTGLYIFMLAFVDQRVRAALLAFLGDIVRHPLRLFAPLHMQGVTVLCGPNLLPSGQIDMCDGCPDITVYEGRLVPTCLMEELRQVQPEPSLTV